MTNIEEVREARQKAEKQANERAELVNNMTGKERYEYYRRQAKATKDKLKLLNALMSDVNKQLVFPKEETTEEEHIELLQKLQDLEHQIIAIKKNKNNSHYFSHKPHVGFNRKQRRANSM